MAVTGAAASIAPQVSIASQISRVPQAILLAVAQAESNFNPSALNTSNSNGTQDYGLFQLNSGTYGPSIYTMTPQQQANAAANQLAQNYSKTGDWSQALSMYNTGSATSATGAAYASNVLGLATNYAAQTGEQIPLSSVNPMGTSAQSQSTPSGVPVVGGFIDWATAHLVPLAVGASAFGLVIFGVYALIGSPSVRKA
jgi:hypothetical protein